MSVNSHLFCCSSHTTTFCGQTIFAVVAFSVTEGQGFSLTCPLACTMKSHHESGKYSPKVCCKNPHDTNGSWLINFNKRTGS